MVDKRIEINCAEIKEELKTDMESEVLVMNDVLEEGDCNIDEENVSNSNIGNGNSTIEVISELQTKESGNTSHIEEAKDCSVQEYDETIGSMYKILKLDPGLLRYMPSSESGTSEVKAIPHLPFFKSEILEVYEKSETPPEVKTPNHWHGFELADKSIKINCPEIKEETKPYISIKSEELILNCAREEKDCNIEGENISDSSIGNDNLRIKRISELQAKESLKTSHIEEAKDCLNCSINEFDDMVGNMHKRLKLDPELLRYMPSFESETLQVEAIPNLPFFKKEPSEVRDRSDIPEVTKHGHVSVNHNEGPSGPISCTMCDKKFTDKYTLASHERTHTGDLLSCAHCPFKTAYKSSLAIHLVKHTGNYHCCTECPGKFCSKTRLRDHIAAKHERSMDFSCSMCPAKFPSQQNLSSHMYYMKSRDTHKKRIECSKCSHKARYESELKLHMLTHEGDGGRPFPCQHCAYSARTKTNLQSHVASVHTPRTAVSRSFPCHLCDFVSYDVLELVFHIDNAHSVESSILPRLEEVSP